jgi:hypothetical protein
LIEMEATNGGALNIHFFFHIHTLALPLYLSYVFLFLPSFALLSLRSPSSLLSISTNHTHSHTHKTRILYEIHKHIIEKRHADAHIHMQASSLARLYFLFAFCFFA